jgi:RNA polymerase sigma-70 factor (ECF subfamily)
MDELISDQEAIGRVREGDLASYEILASRYQQRLQRVARRLVRNDADAEDAVQGAHLLALRHLDQYEGRSSFAGWMSSITANEALTQLRRNRSLVVTGDEPFQHLVCAGRNPEEQAIDGNLGGILNRALDSLPDAYRTVFRLREVESLSTAETGERLGLSEACVKTRLLRARGLLRRRLAKKLKYATAPES